MLRVITWINECEKFVFWEDCISVAFFKQPKMSAVKVSENVQ